MKDWHYAVGKGERRPDQNKKGGAEKIHKKCSDKRRNTLNSEPIILESLSVSDCEAWSLVAIANWSAISIHHVDYSRRRILMRVPSTPHRHFTFPAISHMYRLLAASLLLPLPSTTLQFSPRQIAISAFYRWWLWPYPRCPPPSIFKGIGKNGEADGPLHSDLSGCPLLFFFFFQPLSGTI